ncbi:MAG: alpha/beta hydrolase [Clostridiales bacterium]|nr:alpha/beta hydrolase [Clostridiales bacterium]
MPWIIIACCVVGVFFLLVFMPAWVSYTVVFYVSARHKENPYLLPKGEQFEENRDVMYALIKEMEEIPFERVYLTAVDGKKLSAKYYHVRDGAPLQIQIPGYRGSSTRDLCGGNKLARKYGFNTLVMDLRAHGESQGHTITFGVKERLDTLCWIKYACERFGEQTPIFLVGVSMGAATALMTSDLDLPKNVVGIIADCPYSSPSEVIASVCKKMKLSPKILLPYIRLGARMFGHFRLDDVSATKSVANTQIPILLIHGEDDRFVPCDMSREIYEARNGYVELHTFADAGHALSYMKDYKRYEEITKNFIEHCGVKIR